MTTSTSIDITKLRSARGFGTDVALGDKMTTGEILACVQVLLMGVANHHVQQYYSVRHHPLRDAAERDLTGWVQ